MHFDWSRDPLFHRRGWVWSEGSSKDTAKNGRLHHFLPKRWSSDLPGYWCLGGKGRPGSMTCMGILLGTQALATTSPPLLPAPSAHLIPNCHPGYLVPNGQHHGIRLPRHYCARPSALIPSQHHRISIHPQLHTLSPSLLPALFPTFEFWAILHTFKALIHSLSLSLSSPSSSLTSPVHSPSNLATQILESSHQPSPKSPPSFLVRNRQSVPHPTYTPTTASSTIPP